MVQRRFVQLYLCTALADRVANYEMMVAVTLIPHIEFWFSTKQRIYELIEIHCLSQEGHSPRVDVNVDRFGLRTRFLANWAQLVAVTVRTE